MINLLRENLNRVLFGKSETVDLLLMAMLAGGHVLIEDVPGTGKTTLSKALAILTGAKFSRIQFTPDLLPADVTGGAVYKANIGDFEIKKGPVFTEILLADEINRASPRTQSALLEAMEEKQVSLEGVCFDLPKFFMVLATQNPVEFYGVYPLPEAQMDRFMVRISVGYPAEETELKILQSHKKEKPLDTLKAVVTPREILKIQKEIREIFIDESLERYIVNLVQLTRINEDLRLAASPRAGLNLMYMAEASAYMNGRNFVKPDDIQKVFLPVMEHRIFPKEGANTSKMILQKILKQVDVPN